MDWYAKSQKEVLKELVSSKNGLSEKEVKKRSKEYGKNVLRRIKSESPFIIFLGQFNSLLIYILIIASILSSLIGHFLDAIVIGAIVILNAIIGFAQEYKAEEIIEKLKRSLRYKTLVLREGVQKEIDPKLLVPGDIVLFSPGNRILADCRILEEENLQVNEAVLSGESFPVEKSIRSLKKGVVLAERRNMLYAGTTVVKGKATAVVVNTGRKTEFGKLADLVQTTHADKMPLEKKLNKFSRDISIVILAFVFLAFIMGVSEGIDKVEMFLVSISLAIGAIPEGLPAIIMITLAVAIKQMYRVNTLVRRLPATESLGRTTVICTDKTGTLTEEELVVDKIYSGKIYSMNNLKGGGVNLKKILEIGILCNNARDEEDKILGDPTEIALIKSARKFGIKKKDLTEKNPKIKEYPFDSERKMMSIIRSEGRTKTSYVKGAPLFVLERCTKEFVNGKIRLISKKRRNELKNIALDMEGSGLRALGLAFRQISAISQREAENHLIFVGFDGMLDPPRKEVKEAIKEAVLAGIKIKIITGDSALTTKAIAKKVGIDGEVIGGKELNRTPEDKWGEIVRDKTIFARITPQQKLRVVEILKDQKETVAVTGDGVNDILALKRADVGISMGVRGSDVARDSSDIVLLDDNFASIVGAVKQGRRVFDNIKKSIKFLLSVNIANTFIILTALVFATPLPFLPLAILWMNLVTDSLPALALSVEPVEAGVMRRKPENKNLLHGIWRWILVAGAINFLMVILLFNMAVNNFGLEVARTMALTSSIFLAMFFVFSCKSDKSIIKTGLFNNKYLIYAVLVSTSLHLVAIYSQIGEVLGFASLNGIQLGISVLAGLSGLIVFEVWKIFKKK